MSSRHPDWRKPYTPKKCSYPGCEYVPGTRAYQIRHMEDVHEKKRMFTCPFIGCQFQPHHKAAVTAHYNTIHLKIKRLKCHVCRYRTDYKNALRFHMNVHTKSGHSIEKCDHCRVHLSFTPGRGRVAKDPDSVRKRQCHLCAMLCESTFRLKRHMPSHVKDGHHVESCDYCIRIFADLPHPDPAGRQVVTAATPARRKRKRNRYDEYSSSSEDDESSSASPESSDNDDCYDDSDGGDSGKGQSLAEIPSTSSSTSRRPRLYPKWDKRCHVCGETNIHKNKMRFHMLTHDDEGHDIDHCDHCRTNLAWTLPKGSARRDSLNPMNVVCKAKEKKIAAQYTDEDESESSKIESQSAEYGQQPDNQLVLSGHLDGDDKDMNHEHEDVSCRSSLEEDKEDVDGSNSRAAHAEMDSEEAIMYQKCALFCRSLMSGCESLDLQAAAEDAVTIPVSNATRGSDGGKYETTASQEKQVREEADEVELNDDRELNDNNPVVDSEEEFPHDKQEFGRYTDEEGYAVQLGYHEEWKESVELSSDGETLLITIID